MRWMLMPFLIAAAATAAVPVHADSRDNERYSVRDKEQVQRSLTFGSAGAAVAAARTVEVDNVWGSIQVAAYDGQTVELSATRTLAARTPALLEQARKEVTLDIIEEPALISIYVDGPFRQCDCDNDRFGKRSRRINNQANSNANGNGNAGGNADQTDRASRRSRRNGDLGYQVTYDFVIKVPRTAAIDLSTIMDGDIRVDGTAGDFEVSNVNGGIDMANIAGSGSAHTVNGPVTVLFRKNPTAASSFKSINGEIITYFDPALQADLSMRTMNGKYYSDFDTTQLTALTPVAEVRQSGKRVFELDRDTRVRIGRGGPALRFETLNGDIRILHRGR